MCFKAAKKLIMAPVRATQNLVKDVGDALGLNGGRSKPKPKPVDNSAIEAAAAKAAAEAEAARLAQIEQDRKAAAERALATEAEKARQSEMARTIKAEQDAAAKVLAEQAAAKAVAEAKAAADAKAAIIPVTEKTKDTIAPAEVATVIATPETPLPSTVGSVAPTKDAEIAIPTVATKDVTSPSKQKKLSESLLQRLSKRGGSGRRSLISGSSGGLGFYSRFS